MKLRRPQRSKDVTVFELFCLVLFYTLLWPISIYLSHPTSGHSIGHRGIPRKAGWNWAIS